MWGNFSGEMPSHFPAHKTVYIHGAFTSHSPHARLSAKPPSIFRMTPRLVRLCLAALLLAAAFTARAQTAAPTPPPARPAGATPATDVEMVNELKLPDADLDTVLSTLEMLTGRAVLRPAQLQTSTYNLKITNPISKSEAILAIETVLALNNIGVTEQSDRFLVVSQLQLTRTTAPEMITGSTLDLTPSGKIATKIFQLDFIRVTDLQQMLGGIVNPNLQGLVMLVNANAILVTDSVSNLQRIENLLKTVDQPNVAGLTPRFYTLHNSSATALVSKLTAMLGRLQQQLGQTTTFNADDRTNQVVVFADPRQYPMFDELITKLDVAADPHTRNEVFPLKHANAAKVVTLLTTLISSQNAAAQRANSQSVRPGQSGVQNLNTPIPTPVVPGAPAPNAPAGPTLISASNAANSTEGTSTTNEFSSLMVVAADDRSNSVVVSGTVQDIVLMKDLISKLDVVLAQVRIEVVIAEVTLDDTATSGISALGLQMDGDRLVGFSGSAAGISVAGATAGSVATTSRLGGPGSFGRSIDLTGFISLNTTPRKNNSTILSVPAIVTTHGKQAKFFDGETRPVIGSTTSTPGAAAGLTTTNAINQVDIGTTLTVTPLIGNDGSVELDIVQDISDVTGDVTINGETQYIIGKRQTTSYITAKSGEIIVLGGFQKKIDSKSTNRLGPIPFLGDLFGTRKRDNFHQELIFFLRPTILTNTPADNAETLKRVDALPTRNDILKQIDPNYVPPKESILQKILPK